MSSFTSRYGHMDTSYKAAGEEEGLRKLVHDFYHLMSTLSEARHIRQMHTDSLEMMEDKLALFLCMWLGGHKKYIQKYPFKGMPHAHAHLIIDEEERDAWLLCMDLALDQQDYDEEFKDYLKRQFRFPAEVIRNTAKKA